MDDELRTRIERLETERALTRLAHNYCHGLDRRDFDLFMSVWHDDAIFTTNTPVGTLRGKAAIGDWFSARSTRGATHHWTINFVAEVEGDRATGVSNLSFQGTAPDGTALMGAATYHDDFVRDDGRWVIENRLIEVHHLGPVAGISWAQSTK